MKNRPKDEGKSEILSLVSILSIIVALAAVCLLCLFILNRIGVYDVPWFLSKSKNHDISLTPSDDISNNLFEKNSSKISYISSQASEQTLKNLVISIPERNIYSIRASILYMTTDEEISLTLASARSGDVYKMEITDGSGTVRLAVSCDGKTQTVTEDGETFSSPCGGDGCFYIYSLMPGFQNLLGDNCGIMYTGEDGDTYEIIFDSGSEGIITDVRISMTSGAIISVKSYKNGRPIYSFETLGYSESYDESVFRTD